MNSSIQRLLEIEKVQELLPHFKRVKRGIRDKEKMITALEEDGFEAAAEYHELTADELRSELRILQQGASELADEYPEIERLLNEKYNNILPDSTEE